jgi:adenine-specific DNA-methyltransferase
MKKIAPDDPETKSAEVIAANIDQLKALFPEAFTEGKVDFEVLKQILGGAIDEREEKYGMNWHGKRRAREIALTPSLGTLRPCPEESVDWETTQYLMIEGDNLEVLKLLQKSYAGKVRLIYIDPPYNTGKDFVYPDNFQDNIKNYLEVTGQVNDEGRKLSSNTEASGRFHTNWLSMMYPRLKLARNLLRQDGVLLISVDDAEVDNLRKLCDEVLGKENFVATLVWDRNRKNDAKYFSVGHEYMIVYFKDESSMSENQIMFRAPKEGVEEIRTEFERLKESCKSDWAGVRAGLLKYYSTFDKDDPRQPLARFTKVDEKGPYRDDGNINWPGGDGPRYQVIHRSTGRPCKLPISGWRYPTPERFWEEVAKGRIVFGEDETTVPRVRTNLFENNDQVMGSVQYSYAQTVANQFIALFDGKRVFDNPKPTDDLKRLAAYMTDRDDLVLDFFAGSGSFGHALMALNASDGGRRRFILVQLPEPTRSKKADGLWDETVAWTVGLRSIAEITKERLRRAGKKIREELSTEHTVSTENGQPDLFSSVSSVPSVAENDSSPSVVPRGPDLGFRVFKLDSTNIRAWDPKRENLSQTLLNSVEHVKADRTEQDILFELLLKLGLELTVPIEQKTIAGKTVHSVGAGALFVCLAPEITHKEIEPLANGIADWRKELAPVGETQVVFRDSAFADDVAKTNLTAILAQRGLEKVRSL